MSQPAPIVKPRARRASRAPVGRSSSQQPDENALGLAAPPLPRLATKSSTASLNGAGPAVGRKVAGLGSKSAVTIGTSSGVVAPAQARRAFGDVTNAASRVAVATDRLSKEIPTFVKPVVARSRQTSSTSTTTSTTQALPAHPSSGGIGISRLKIGASSSTSTSNATVKRTIPGRPKIAQGKWGSSNVKDEEVEELVSESDHPNFVPGVGLGITGLNESNFPSTAHSHKRELNSDDDFSFPEEEGEGSATKVRVVDRGVGVHVHHHQQQRQQSPLIRTEAKEDEEELEEEEVDEEDWLRMSTEELLEQKAIVENVKELFEEQLDYWDTTMVAEYSEEIFQYMGELEEKAMPNPRYMDHQTEIEWSMRTTLIDWLLQVHMRYHMLPETLWIAINIIDRFLSNRVVSLVKFQLVGVTAMFIAAKYEEIMAPGVEEFVFMTENGYTRDEILKGERIILTNLEFNISPYCSPYTWVRRISKADDYDIQTRTLSKFLMEVTLLDHRFLRAKPSMIAAIGMFLARKMLGGDWNEGFVYYSNFTEAQLLLPTSFLIELIGEAGFDEKFLYKKYSSKKYLKASTFARNWCRTTEAQEFWASASVSPSPTLSEPLDEKPLRQ